MKRVCLVGCGRLGRVIADGLLAGKVPGMELAAVLVRTEEKAEKLQAALGCPAVTDLQKLLTVKPAYVIEAAGSTVVRQITVPVLEAGADLIALSTSSFGEPVFYEQARDAAVRCGRKIHLAHGVIGGLDVVETAAMMGEVTASLTKRKFSRGSAKSDAALDALADEFHASAAEALNRYPDQLNVAVSLALAAGELEGTMVHVSSAEAVDFTVRCSGTFGEATFYTHLGDLGPDLAAWSALAMLRRLTAPIAF